MATIKPFALFFVPSNVGRQGDHSLNGADMGDEGGGMRHKRHDWFRPA